MFGDGARSVTDAANRCRMAPPCEIGFESAGCLETFIYNQHSQPLEQLNLHGCAAWVAEAKGQQWARYSSKKSFFCWR
jgi:hypothetical protein